MAWHYGLVTLFNDQWQQRYEDSEPMRGQDSDNAMMVRCWVGDVTNNQDIELICAPLVTHYYNHPWKWGVGRMTMTGRYRRLNNTKVIIIKVGTSSVLHSGPKRLLPRMSGDFYISLLYVFTCFLLDHPQPFSCDWLRIPFSAWPTPSVNNKY